MSHFAGSSSDKSQQIPTLFTTIGDCKSFSMLLLFKFAALLPGSSFTLVNETCWKQKWPFRLRWRYMYSTYHLWIQKKLLSLNAFSLQRFQCADLGCPANSLTLLLMQKGRGSEGKARKARKESQLLKDFKWLIESQLKYPLFQRWQSKSFDWDFVSHYHSASHSWPT